MRVSTPGKIYGSSLPDLGLGAQLLSAASGGYIVAQGTTTFHILKYVTLMNRLEKSLLSVHQCILRNLQESPGCKSLISEALCSINLKTLT